jgi:hypothetical protein
MGQVGMPQFHAMLADVLIIGGEQPRARRDSANLSINASTGDRYVDAELHRFPAACHLALGEPKSAEAALCQRSGPCVLLQRYLTKPACD